MVLLRQRSEIEIHLNARLEPAMRVPFFEKRLIRLLRRHGWGPRVTGGGTMFSAAGEPMSCDVVVEIPGEPHRALALAVAMLDYMGAPKGSSATRTDTDERMELGRYDGVGLYLNGTDLPDQVYDEYPVDLFLDRVAQKGMYEVTGYWQYWHGPRETAVYFYGPSEEKMRTALQPLIEQERLAQGSRVVTLISGEEWTRTEG
jgi:hypothetical protein